MDEEHTCKCLSSPRKGEDRGQVCDRANCEPRGVVVVAPIIIGRDETVFLEKHLRAEPVGCARLPEFASIDDAKVVVHIDGSPLIIVCGRLVHIRVINMKPERVVLDSIARGDHDMPGISGVGRKAGVHEHRVVGLNRIDDGLKDLLRLRLVKGERRSVFVIGRKELLRSGLPRGFLAALVQCTMERFVQCKVRGRNVMLTVYFWIYQILFLLVIHDEVVTSSLAMCDELIVVVNHAR